MIPDLFVYNRSRNIFLLIPYFLLNIATYASLAPMMLKTVFLGACGKKAVFLVTPKQSEKFTLGDAFKYTYDSLVFALVVGALCFLACGSLLPVMFIMVGCLFAPAIVLLSNIPVKRQKRQTVKMSASKGKRAEKKTVIQKNSGNTVPSEMAERQ